MIDLPDSFLVLLWIVGSALGVGGLVLDVHHDINRADASTLRLAAPDSTVI